MTDKPNVMAMLSLPVTGMTISSNTGWVGDFQTTSTDAFHKSGTVWDFWEREYYPKVIRESYPVYIQERSMDKGQKAFEIIKLLQDKKLVKMEKVGDFIDAMDALIKVL